MKRQDRLLREQEMKKMHQEMIAKGVRRMDAIYSIAFKYNLSVEQTYRILRM